VSRGAQDAVAPAKPDVEEGTTGNRIIRGEPSSYRIVYRQSRCPGCHGAVSLRYQVTMAEDGSCMWKLLSSSIGHPMCVEELNDLRRSDPRLFVKELHGHDIRRNDR
jgi:hypothetical protein